MLYYSSKAITDAGNIREVNQDSYVRVDDFINNRYVGIYCVADGMGGLSDGGYASKTAIGKTLQWYRDNLHIISKKMTSKKKIKDSLKELFYNINSELYNYGQIKRVMLGTTYSLLLIIDRSYFIVHAGDSRIYLKRSSGLYMLTKDQTWVNDQFERGFISWEEAQNHPKKNLLINCMGCSEKPTICMGEGNIECNDCFLLCSDGLYNLITTDEISVGMSYEDIERALKRFIGLAKQRGAYDNITMLMVRIINVFDEEAVTDIT